MPTANGTPVIRTALAIGVMGVLWTAVPSVDAWIKSRFADRLARHAEASTNEVARLAVQRLADGGPHSLPALVRLAASANPDAAGAARDALLNRLAAWQTEFRSKSNSLIFAERLDNLARALSRHVGEFDAAGRAWADRMALTIVRHSDALPAGATVALLANCDRVLKAPPAHVRATAVAAQPGSLASVPVAAQASSASQDFVTQAVPGLADASETPAAAVPSPTPSEMVVVPLAPTAPATTADASPAVVPKPSQADDPAATVVVAEPPAAAASATTASAQPRPLPPPAADPSLVDVPSPTEARLMLRRYRRLAQRDLQAALAASSGYEALAIQQVLRERQAPVAAGPRAAGRPPAKSDAEQQLSDRVSNLPPTEARQLLRNLAANADEPAELRLQALALLATSGDPQLASIARERALNDPDPSVADLAARIIRDAQQR